MNTLEYVHSIILPTTLALLPAKMDSPEARALTLAIGLQESQFLYRTQTNGPARGYWQFEREGGVKGVLTHEASRPYIVSVLSDLNYSKVADSFTATATWSCHDIIADNDFLACAFARLLLWTSPVALPKQQEAHDAWIYYVSNWRPGKPRPETWDANYERAWGLQ